MTKLERGMVIEVNLDPTLGSETLALTKDENVRCTTTRDQRFPSCPKDLL